MVNDNHQVVNSEINHGINNDHVVETFERSPDKDLSLQSYPIHNDEEREEIKENLNDSQIQNFHMS
jgi:hypothetical protein